MAEELVRALVANPIDVPPHWFSVRCRLPSKRSFRSRGARAARDDSTGAPRQIQADSEMKVRAGLLMAEIAKKEGSR